jgi:acyl-CoA thioester hydrolase
MFCYKIQPRFSETDALGHINNTVVPVWFESARGPIFEIFNPTQNLTQWNLILAKIEVQYLAQMHYNDMVEIQTSVQKVGTSSLTLSQSVWQNDQQVAKGDCVLVKFNYENNKPEPITDLERTQLNIHLS